jgi:hypothetical protein
MDIQGGMSSDIYDSMAQGVQKAAVLLCFMSRTYQISENCKLELQFARQTGTPIVPVMLEDPDEWSATGWLGVITAGMLWTPLGNASHPRFDGNIDSLCGQVKIAVGYTDDGGGASTQDDEEEIDEVDALEVRRELDRLRSDVSLTKSEPGANTAADGELCTLPAAVPYLSADVRIANPMKALVKAVLAPTSKLRIGFHGMGGCGKTTTSAWLCHEEEVRKHFGVYVWVPLGQTPNIVACQQLMLQQLTGVEHPLQSMTTDQRHESLRMALQGKDCLLVLDVSVYSAS